MSNTATAVLSCAGEGERLPGKDYLLTPALSRRERESGCG
ncbi:hypothetical protein CHELA41_23484 [Hyphomicrobiales bacterium]|nr:hypothetical protein CHELA41_23484 [Hyphomicrobiales bacterium]